MEERTVSRVEDWDARSFPSGYDSLHELSDGGFSGAVRTRSGTWAFLLNGRVLGVFEGSIEDFEDEDGSIHEAPHPSLPLLFTMLERGGEQQAKYYTNDTPISEAHRQLSDASFTGFIELSENVLSGDYYVVYYGGSSMSCAFVGNAERLETGDEAFELADDEVGIYEVLSVDIDVVEIPESSTGTSDGRADERPDQAAGGHDEAGQQDDPAQQPQEDAGTTRQDQAGEQRQDPGHTGGQGAAADQGTPDQPPADRPAAGQERGQQPSAGQGPTEQTGDATDAAQAGRDPPAEPRDASDPGQAGAGEPAAGKARDGTGQGPGGHADEPAGAADARSQPDQGAGRDQPAGGQAEQGAGGRPEQGAGGRPEQNAGGQHQDPQGGRHQEPAGGGQPKESPAGGQPQDPAGSGRQEPAGDQHQGSASQPQGNAGSQPQETTGNQHQGAAGGQPQGTAGSQPQGTAGNQPQGTAGNQPQGTAGNQPPGTAGNQPQETADSRPQEPAGGTQRREQGGHGAGGHQPAGGQTASGDRSGAESAGAPAGPTPVSVERFDATQQVPSLDPDRTGVDESGDSAAAAAGSAGGQSATESSASSATTSGSTSAAGDATGSTDATGGTTTGSTQGTPTGGSRSPEEATGGAVRSTDADQASGGEAVDAAVAAEASAGDLRAELAEREERIEDLEAQLADLRVQRDGLRDERDRLREEVEQLEAEIADLEEEVEHLRTQLNDGIEGKRRLDPEEALRGTNLFVRYGSKSGGTLEKAHAGDVGKEEVSNNLRLEHHTQFEAEEVAVDGEPFEQFLDRSLYKEFVDWLIHDLLYEIRGTGHVKGLKDLYDALPQVDRAELLGQVSVEYTEDGEQYREQRTFDVVLRDRMGNPLVVADINDSRNPATREMMTGVIENASDVKESNDSLASALLVTASFFEPGALEAADEAAGGGILGSGSRESFVRLSRKRGYHLLLVETRGGEFHVNVPEL
ncbi:transcriptional regulator [Halobacteriales archaeon QS_1_68_20]|nr:MAG: transcriptional regulator [Halobacteriales archaeon QS_1_68_20]